MQSTYYLYRFLKLKKPFSLNKGLVCSSMEKCCFIHFKPGNKENAVTAEFDVKKGGRNYKTG